MDSFDFSSLTNGGSTTPGLWSLRTGLTPLPLSATRGLEYNPFDQAYAPNESTKRPFSADDSLPAAKRVKSQGLTTHDPFLGKSPAGHSSTSGSTPSVETPPTEAEANGANGTTATRKVVDAGTYGQAMAEYLAAHNQRAARGGTIAAGGTSMRLSRSASAAGAANIVLPTMPSYISQPPPVPASYAPHLLATSAPASTMSVKVEQPIASTSAQSEPRGKGKKATAKGKGGRKAKKNTVGDEDEGEDSGEPSKRADFLERNRQAAVRSRQKKKEWLQGLEGHAQTLTEANGTLQEEIERLRQEVASLRGLIAGHVANGCTSAQHALTATRADQIPSSALQPASPSYVGGHHRTVSLNNAVDIPVDPALQQPQFLPVPPARKTRASSAPPTSTPSFETNGATGYFDLPIKRSMGGGGPSSDVDLSAYLA